jgi:hypothetical protein
MLQHPLCSSGGSTARRPGRLHPPKNLPWRLRARRRPCVDDDAAERAFRPLYGLPSATATHDRVAISRIASRPEGERIRSAPGGPSSTKNARGGVARSSPRIAVKSAPLETPITRALIVSIRSSSQMAPPFARATWLWRGNPSGSHALMKARRSWLIVSAWVVSMPCGKPE